MGKKEILGEEIFCSSVRSAEGELFSAGSKAVRKKVYPVK